MLNKVPTLVGFLGHLKVKFNVERYAAMQSFKVHKFEKKNGIFGNIFLTDNFLSLFFLLFIINVTTITPFP